MLNTQMRVKRCLDDIKEQHGARFYKKIEEEFQAQIKDWMARYKAHVSFVELLHTTNEENVSLEVKEQIYQGLETYL